MVYQIIFSGGLVFMGDVSPWWHWMFEVIFNFLMKAATVMFTEQKKY